MWALISFAAGGFLVWEFLHWIVRNGWYSMSGEPSSDRSSTPDS